MTFAWGGGVGPFVVESGGLADLAGGLIGPAMCVGFACFARVVEGIVAVGYDGILDLDGLPEGL